MDDVTWSEAAALLARSADEMQILGRCLDVQAHLEDFHASCEHPSAAPAANALDQALVMLEELAGGEATRLVLTVSRVLGELPPSLDGPAALGGARSRCRPTLPDT